MVFFFLETFMVIQEKGVIAVRFIHKHILNISSINMLICVTVIKFLYWCDVRVYIYVYIYIHTYTYIYSVYVYMYLRKWYIFELTNNKRRYVITWISANTMHFIMMFNTHLFVFISFKTLIYIKVWSRETYIHIYYKLESLPFKR